MTTHVEGLHAALQTLMCAQLPGIQAVQSLQQLSAGASMETWSFDAVGEAQTLPLILRRPPPANMLPGDFESLGTEAAVIRAAVAAGVAAPVVRHVLREAEG